MVPGGGVPKERYNDALTKDSCGGGGALRWGFSQNVAAVLKNRSIGRKDARGSVQLRRQGSWLLIG